MRFLLSEWDPFRRIRNRSAWHGSDPAAAAMAAEGEGALVSLHACGRAILASEDCDLQWAAACRRWDEVRIDIRRITDEAMAWRAVHQALLKLHTDIRGEFGPDFMEVYRNVDH